MEKMGKGGEGGEEKIYFFTPQPLPRLCTNPLPVKHPVTIQDGGIEPIYVAFRSEITPALQARYFVVISSPVVMHVNNLSFSSLDLHWNTFVM